ncbi:MAG: AAA family ATPase [Anaerolineae bacterium]
MSTVQLLSYSPKLFVNREEELKILEDRVRALKEGRDGHGVLILRGERGVGKTWLRSHFQDRLMQEKIHVIPIDLKEYVGKDPTWTVAAILQRVSIETGGPDKRLGGDLAEMSRTLFRHLREFLQRQPLVVIVDHVYESDWTLLPLLEDYLLGPLAVEQRVLLVLTGRGRLYPWKNPELSTMATSIGEPESRLRPFDQPSTKEQLKRQVPSAVDRAEEIYQLTGGNPLANYLIAAYDLNQAMEGLLAPVPKEHLREIRGYLEALCVLRSFDEERIPNMLAAYYDDDSYRQWTYAQARRVREELIRWGLARWDPEQRGYVMDRIVRRLAERYLQTQKPERWRKLHQAAQKLYEQWENDYSATRDRWREEAEYHRQRLEDQSSLPLRSESITATERRSL